VRKGLESGRAALNRTREQLGLPPQSRFHGGTSEQLALVGSFPQLEYPRRWPAHVHVVGPLMWEPPGEQVVPPTPPRSSRDGSDTERPVVLIAPSTSQDPEHRLLLAALKGLADAPVRVIATWNKRLPPRPLPVPENATVVDWVSYSKTMPLCDLVVCHAGHGTLARALSNGCPVIACPVAGDMNENAARVAWSGAGMRLPRRFIAPRPLRLAVERAVGDEAMRASAQEIAAWAAERDPADEAAALVEQLAETTAPASGPLSATAH
jgi:UDP:flavonoid glycosyltransferase YjiC (YdhE family)